MDQQLWDLLKEIRTDVKNISKETTENTASLKEHMRRTDLLEKHVSGTDSRLKMYLGVFATIITIAVGVLKFG